MCVRGHDISTQLISGAAQHNTTQRGCARFLPIYTAHFLSVGTNAFQMAYSSNQFGQAFSSNCAYFQLNTFLSAWHQICCLECKAEVDWIGEGDLPKMDHIYVYASHVRCPATAFQGYLRNITLNIRT